MTLHYDATVLTQGRLDLAMEAETLTDDERRVVESVLMREISKRFHGLHTIHVASVVITNVRTKPVKPARVCDRDRENGTA